MARTKIGVIGLGNMGRGIADNLIAAGYPVEVWDVTPNAVEAYAARNDVVTSGPAEIAAHCGVIFFVVPSSVEIGAMLGGRGGMLASARKGQVIYDLTTSDPAHSKKLARKAAKKGVAYLDAGMSGGATGAAAGTLTLMIGGDKKAYTRTRRYLEPIANRLFHLGASGAGHAMKLIHNMVCHTIFLATCEGGRIAERAGLELGDMIEVFNVSNARSYASEARFPAHILSGKWNAKSRVYNLHKDLSMAVDLAGQVGVEAALGKDTLVFLGRAMSHGMAEQDFSLLYRDFDEIG
jgi:3-hydroxyisobutyrate dehydrogenase